MREARKLVTPKVLRLIDERLGGWLARLCGLEDMERMVDAAGEAARQSSMSDLDWKPGIKGKEKKQ